MNKSLIRITALVCLAFYPVVSHGEDKAKNKQFGGDVFTEPAENLELQILLGLGDAGAMYLVNKVIHNERNASPAVIKELTAAQTQLAKSQQNVTKLTEEIQTASKGSTGSASQTKIIEAARTQLTQAETKLAGIAAKVGQNDVAMTKVLSDAGLLKTVVNSGTVVIDASKIQSGAEKSLYTLSAMNDETQKAMLKSISEASGEVTAARGALLQAMQEAGSPEIARLAKSAEAISVELTTSRAAILNALIKAKPTKLGRLAGTVKVFGNVVFFGDGATRVYVWNGLKANPGYFPVGKLSMAYAQPGIEKLQALDSQYGVSTFIQVNGKAAIKKASETANDYYEKYQESRKPASDTHNE